VVQNGVVRRNVRYDLAVSCECPLLAAAFLSVSAGIIAAEMIGLRLVEARRSAARSSARRRRAASRPLLVAGGLLALQTAYAHATKSASDIPPQSASAVQGGAQSGGNPARGRSLVESSQCLDCHRIGETGSRIGPDLSEIGRMRSPEQLHRALVAPDAEVLPENRFVHVVTRDGISSTGRLLNQDAFSIQLIDKDEHLRSYLKANLREHTIIVKSTMPSYEGRLTAQQIADVVSYLGELKGVEK
jgi:putative heme-binding domain-containing protein